MLLLLKLVCNFLSSIDWYIYRLRQTIFNDSRKQFLFYGIETASESAHRITLHARVKVNGNCSRRVRPIAKQVSQNQQIEIRLVSGSKVCNEVGKWLCDGSNRTFSFMYIDLIHIQGPITVKQSLSHIV